MKKFTKIGTCTALVGAIVLGGAVAANAHGLVGNGLKGGLGPSDVTARQAMPNTGLGSVQWDTQSVEGPKGFSLDPATGGPADGQLASGGNKQFSELDAQSPERWIENEVEAGQTIDLSWYYTAPHKTSQWHYYITKNGWDQNAPLTRDQLQLLQTVTWDGSAAAAQPNTNGAVQKIKLPADHTGDHVILAVWDVADTANAFYNAIDIHIDGEAQPEKPDTVAPSAPSNVHAMKVTTNTVDLMWNASSDNVGVDRYEIQRAVKGGEFEKVGTTAGTSFKDTGLTASTAYDYRVVAIDGAGNTSAAGTFSVTTKDEVVNPGPDTEAPTAPSGVHSMKTTADSVDLMWSESEDNVGVDRYEIQRAVKGGQFQTVGSTAKTSHLDTGLTAGTTYEYKVVAFDAAGNASAASDVFTVTTKADTNPGPVDPTVKPWAANGTYKKGDRVSHNGSTYEALQDHRGYGDPNWIDSPALWKKIG
ncbi:MULTISPECIES: lytic polysaccharide monooxygenase [unclassified Microbacterium]|uniref:lytic polysaccharide monooxygenase n=1 Tax=unclassified Microbacterium TaxID=2609290 RepID=UPI00301029BD